MLDWVLVKKWYFINNNLYFCNQNIVFYKTTLHFTAPDQQHSYKSKGYAQDTGKPEPTEMVAVRESDNDTAKG